MSTMTAAEVESEVRSVFGKAMGNRGDFPFSFLQPTGAGSRTLMVPSVSSSFEWTPPFIIKYSEQGSNKHSSLSIQNKEVTSGQQRKQS